MFKKIWYFLIGKKAEKNNGLVLGYCDSCSKQGSLDDDDNGKYEKKKLKHLDIEGTEGLKLCKNCWNTQMEWRKNSNRNMRGNNRYPIREWV